MLTLTTRHSLTSGAGRVAKPTLTRVRAAWFNVRMLDGRECHLRKDKYTVDENENFGRLGNLTKLNQWNLSFNPILRRFLTL